MLALWLIAATAATACCAAEPGLDGLLLFDLPAAELSAVAAVLVVGSRAGLLGLWPAISAWPAARFVTLTWRARGSAWLVTGAVRR